MRTLVTASIMLVGALAGTPTGGSSPISAPAAEALALPGDLLTGGHPRAPGLGPAPDAESPTEARPYRLVVPESYEAGTPAPLVVSLHGYTSSGEAQDTYFQLSPLAEEEGFLLATPDGTRDRVGNRFWNATDACCDFFGSGVDDVAYLDAVLDEISAEYTVDPARVYLVGHSNGAFMAHRYACDRADRVAAIVTLAGMQWSDETRCEPDAPVSVLHVHGRQDQTIRYEGGSTPGAAYPGAEATVAAWAGENGCSATVAEPNGKLDLEAAVPGEETVTAAVAGCGPGAVELWTIEDSGHVPAFNDDWAPSFWAFMEANPKV